jgi:hypothetical protein
MDTSGFYKNSEDNLLYGPNFVDAGSFLLRRETKDYHTYPTGGWYWFDTEEEAYSFFGLTKPPMIPPENNNFNNT